MIVGCGGNNSHISHKQKVAVSGRIFEKTANEIELRDFAGFEGLK